MTFTLLALGRMVVRKIIAEPDRKGPPSTKQKGLRHNTIAFPQARCLELLTDALLAEPAVARVYLADTISIVLAGSEPEALEKSTWAQVPRDAYLTAARFCIAHLKVYQHIRLDEDRAKQQFATLVPDVIK